MSFVDPFGSYDMFNSFIHPENAYKGAEEQANKGWEEAQNYERPFWQQGQDQYGKLNNAENELLDPATLQNKWAAGYEQSPYAQQLLKQNQAQGLDAASAMGLGGSSAAIGNIQQGAGNIVQKDRQQFMDDLMKKYLAGIGIGQNIYGVGAQTGANLGAGAAEHGNNAAGLAYGRLAAPGKLFGQVAGSAVNYLSPGAGDAFVGGGNNFNSGQPSWMQ